MQKSGDFRLVTKASFSDEIQLISDDYSIAFFDVVKNEYVKQADGTFDSYTGWDRSGFIPVTPGEYVYFKMDAASLGYCAYYTSNNTGSWIKRFTAYNGSPVLIPANAHYMAVSGSASDIASTRIYRFDHLYSNGVNGNLLGMVFNNSYVKTNGAVSSYDGYTRTDYINVEGVDVLTIQVPAASDYNAFYDASKTFIDGSNFSVVSGSNTVSVPYGAKYLMMSGSGSYANNLTINVANTICETDIKVIKNNINVNTNGKHYIALTVDDMLFHKACNSSTGTLEDNNSAAVTQNYYRIDNSQNKYLVSCPGYGIYVHQYSEEANGTLTWLRRSSWLVDGGYFWATSQCTHIRIECWKVSGTEMALDKLRDFCNIFTFSESNDINKYLRVCTFNQAADYPHFTRDTEEALDQRIINYLNFIGEYNPDVICAQEALGTYFQPTSFEKQTGPVFNRKYLFPWQGGTQRKIWSKYNFSQRELVYFSNNTQDIQRFYLKTVLYFEGKEIVLINTHCAYQGDDDFDYIRKGEFQQLVQELTNNEYCIVCGDFNAWDAEEFDLFNNFNKANCGDYGVIDTWYIDTEYPDWPFKALDNIITTTNIVIQNVVRGPYDFRGFSDHAPLIADLQIR